MVHFLVMCSVRERLPGLEYAPRSQGKDWSIHHVFSGSVTDPVTDPVTQIPHLKTTTLREAEPI